MSKTSQGPIFAAICDYGPFKSPAHKSIMYALLRHADFYGATNSSPGRKLLAREAGLSMRRVEIILRDLETDGFIITKNRKGGRGNKTSYDMNLVKLGLVIEDTKPTLNGRIPYARTDQDFSSWQKAESEKQNVPNPSPFIGR